VAAPVSIAHTHVHSLRLASGAEALVARVRTTGGNAGFGFSLNLEAGIARDIAAWDALGRSKGVPLHALLGGTYRSGVKCIKDENPALAADWTALRKGVLDNRYDLLRIDPFAWGSVEMVQTIAAVAMAFDLGIALLAPNAHPWEIQYCAALAATLKGDDSRIVLRQDVSAREIEIPDQPGLGIDWSQEPSFSKIQWQS
jgi:L-alanine-DL-glutamate epimerase-like enolase superfamily enzyme